MSDFFTTLAARVRPVAPPIEPRRASLFASSGRESAAPESSAERDPPAPTVRDHNHPQALISPISPVRPNTPVGPAGPAASPAVVAEPAPRPAPAAPRIEPSSAGIPPPENARDERRDPAPAAPPAAQNPTPPVIFAPTREVHTERIVTERILVKEVAPAAAPAELPSSPPPTPRADPLLAAPLVRLLEPAATAKPEDPAHRDALSDAPVIRVSIGRVEVRAVVPPALPAASPALPRKPNPVISLDDYLKQQASRSARA